MLSRDSIRSGAELFLIGASIWLLVSTMLQWPSARAVMGEPWGQFHLQVLRRLWHNQNIAIAVGVLSLALALLTRRFKIHAVTIVLSVSTFLVASHLMGLIPGKG